MRFGRFFGSHRASLLTPPWTLRNGSIGAPASPARGSARHLGSETRAAGKVQPDLPLAAPGIDSPRRWSTPRRL
ncbi:hypothetical protein PCL1606_32450 [Pseudomonas chlororaphis]|uniref:Uncharacterized protein n=1 Tax=Pseudomonas chlororaphis TaxID=587753 RepID=A0A0D5Y135_9PSED|nr:hypothetical protein PCL1606_32450 [Pseudomonas chlororaphis]